MPAVLPFGEHHAARRHDRLAHDDHPLETACT
jgi:hypothetical protein